MPRQRRWFLSSCAALALPGAAAAASGASTPLPRAEAAALGISQSRLARLDRFMTIATDARGYLGAVTMIARHGRLVHWQAHGHLDLARQQPMPPEAIFRIYSMTKTITSVGALMLLEQGRLTLDDPVAAHLPQFAALQVLAGGNADAPLLRAPSRQLTVRHLLTHTTGFAVGAPGTEEATRLLERAAPSRASDLQDFARRVAGVPLATDPGTQFTYDGVNTEVLAHLIEVVSGEPFQRFLQRHILAPLQMHDTGFAVPAGPRDRIATLTATATPPATGLVPGPGRSVVEPGRSLNDYSSGAGGLYSTAPDYLRFCQMLLDGRSGRGRSLLGRKTIELMMANQLSAAQVASAHLTPGEGFGLGGSVVLDPALRGRLGSAGAFGWSGAASTYYTIDPREQLVAILLAQHLPRDDVPGELPRLQVKFFNLVYQSLV